MVAKLESSKEYTSGAWYVERNLCMTPFGPRAIFFFISQFFNFENIF